MTDPFRTRVQATARSVSREGVMVIETTGGPGVA